jgi:hypothetical protein
MIRRSTIEKQVAEIDQLDAEAFYLSRKCEKRHGFITPQVEKQLEKIEAKITTRRDRIITRLVAEGVIESDLGVTDREAQQRLLRDIPGLHLIGDGDWTP